MTCPFGAGLSQTGERQDRVSCSAGGRRGRGHVHVSWE